MSADDPGLQRESVPSFEQWRDYCLTQAYADWASSYDQAADERQARIGALEPACLTRYLTRLLREPADLAECYSDDQIGVAIWYLFGIPSGYFAKIQDSQIDPRLQIECYFAVETFYTDLLDRVCCKHGAEPDKDFADELPVDGAVYMIWDMACFKDPMRIPDAAPHLVEPSFEVLEHILARCGTSTCWISALHGLGHVVDTHEERVRRMIFDFLGRRHVPDWVRAYALQACEGRVQ